MYFWDNFSHSGHRRKRFSLVELLVVLAIIGILSSSLLTSLAKAREKGQIAICLNNEKQIITSTFLFMDDNDGLFPGDHSDTGSGWNDQLSSYDGRNLTDDQITGAPGEFGVFHWNVSG